MTHKYVVHRVTKYRVTRIDSPSDSAASIRTVLETDSYEDAARLATMGAAAYGGEFVGSLGISPEADVGASAAEPFPESGLAFAPVLADLDRIKRALIELGAVWSERTENRIRSIVGL